MAEVALLPTRQLDRDTLALRVLAALQDVPTLVENLEHQRRELAALRGDVARLLAGQRAIQPDRPDEALDRLVDAAHRAMRGATWTATDLLCRSIGPDPAARELLSAIYATSARQGNARSLGVYFARRIDPEKSYVTESGLEIRRGSDGRLAVWTVSAV